MGKMEAWKRNWEQNYACDLKTTKRQFELVKQKLEKTKTKIMLLKVGLEVTKYKVA